jgi:hypothetical protein
VFGLDDFKRIVRMSRSFYNELCNHLCQVQLFFRDGVEVTNREKISTDAKILIALKYLAYGCSVNCFQDYFQIGESTVMSCVKKFTKEVCNSEFQSIYFGSITPADARRVEAMHHDRPFTVCLACSVLLLWYAK